MAVVSIRNPYLNGHASAGLIFQLYQCANAPLPVQLFRQHRLKLVYVKLASLIAQCTPKRQNIIVVLLNGNRVLKLQLPKPLLQLLKAKRAGSVLVQRDKQPLDLIIKILLRVESAQVLQDRVDYALGPDSCKFLFLFGGGGGGDFFFLVGNALDELVWSRRVASRCVASPFMRQIKSITSREHHITRATRT